MSINISELKIKFTEMFKNEPRLFRAPGRVNLIGEHTDYNGGFVLPLAINCEVAIAISQRRDRQILAHSINLNESGEVNLDLENKRKKGYWLNYVEGVARILERRKINLTGADLLIWSDVPSGAGLSSSAALETAVALALSETSGQTIDRTILALVGQQTEHEFVGANVGIMDQFVSANAQKGHALLLDCRSLEFENVPLDTSKVAVVICNTNVKHDLATSEYNTRRRECEEGVKIFQKHLPAVKELRDVSAPDFDKLADQLPEIVRRRCRHVVTEIERTLKAAEALKKNDLKEFGRLMWLSHASLRDDYAVSCRELDVLVEIAQDVDGVLGARMTGGGFGGSTVNLVERESLAQFEQNVFVKYQNQIGITPDIFVVESSDGASEIK